MDKTLFYFCNVVVPLLTYLLMKKDLTPEEVNGHVVDVVAGGVDTVRNSNDNLFVIDWEGGAKYQNYKKEEDWTIRKDNRYYYEAVVILLNTPSPSRDPSNIAGNVRLPLGREVS